MNHLLDDDDDLKQEREFTLSTGAILGIFLGLVLVCGLFFGFGYNLGSKSKSPATTNETDAASGGSPATSGKAKPSAGSFVAQSAVQAQQAVVTPTAVPTPQQHADAPAPAQTAPEPAQTQAPAARTPTPLPTSSANGVFVVQVAAVSHQEDAALLVNALRGRGYTVAARSEPTDRLIHIQVGPFETKAEAATMRDRLLADGYNAIVK